MLDPYSDTVLRWTCPGCHAEWFDRGRGFHGQRFSNCLGCGVDACEPHDTRPALAPYPELPPAPHPAAPTFVTAGRL